MPVGHGHPGQVQPPGAVLDERPHVQPVEQHRLDNQEVTGDDGVRLAVGPPPCRPGPPRRGIDAATCRITRLGRGDRMPEPGQLPSIRPGPKPGSLAPSDDQRLDQSRWTAVLAAPAGVVHLRATRFRCRRRRGQGDQEDLRPLAAAHQPGTAPQARAGRHGPTAGGHAADGAAPGSRGAAPATRCPWTGQSGPAPPAGSTGTSASGRQATAARRDGLSPAPDPAAKPQLTARNRVSEQDTVASGRTA